MTIHFAQRVEGLRASEIREILKLTQRPGVISFAGGLPAPELFPVEELIEASREVLAHQGGEALQYSTTEGEVPLRSFIARRMNERLGTAVDPASVLITAGSQQGLDLAGRLFLDPGSVVLCESPTYLGAIQAFRAYQPRFVDVATDDDGMLPADLERALAGNPDARLIYVIPDFQNPTGRTWSLERRGALMALANRLRIPVIEDNPYGELRFEGTPRPPLAALDTQGLVIYLGTFSKVFCPGMRLGWLCAAPEIFEKFVLAKQGADLHTSTLGQRQLVAYLERHGLDANITRIREVYRRRRAAMIAAIEREMPPGVRFTRPEGGLFLWLELPEGIDARELLAVCLEHDVAFVPGGPFFPNGGHENTLRLNYSAMPETRIDEGITRLAAAVREFMAQAGVEAEPAAAAAR